jgi:predicted homoserine dehydrogenase-like protein
LKRAIKKDQIVSFDDVKKAPAGFALPVRAW